ncbi:tetratricopeptide repeat protein [Candidatus Binatia bacterium]|nr:tetratricopeptide repeat protein [Candidatus Binatia bacterium]
MRDLLLAVLLATSVLVAYAGVRQHDFVNFDDPEYVVQNRHVTSGLTAVNVAWALTAVHSANWHPLTWMSHMLDCSLYGLWPGGHHLTNVLLHALATVLLFCALRTLTGAPGRSAFVAALFALHPRNVESVAWISERKDVLSAVFWTGAMWAHAAYARRTTTARYLGVVVLLVLGLLAKPMVVTLPAALLLLDVWPLRRVRIAGVGDAHAELGEPGDRVRAAVGSGGTGAEPAPPLGTAALLREYLPLLAIVLAAAVVTFAAQRSSGAVATLAALPLGFRLQNVVVTYAAYLWSLAWPTELAVFYPYRTLPVVEVVASLVLLIGLSALAWRTRRTRPYLLIGWLWYLGTLLPVIGVVKAGDQAMADRFTYLPAIGIFLAATWALADAAARDPRARRALAPAALIVLATCLLTTRAQVRHWRDSVTLFEHALAVTAQNPLAELNLASALVERGDVTAGLEHARAAQALRPNDVKVLATLGTALARSGRGDESAAAYQRALREDPDSVLALLGMAVLLAERQQWPDAERAYGEVLRRAPEHAKAHAGLGFVLAAQGRHADAITHYRAAIAEDDTLLQAYNGLALALEDGGDRDEALRVLESTLRRAPAEQRLRLNYAAMLVAGGRAREAEQQYRDVLRAETGNVAARIALADLLAQSGRVDEARRELATAAEAARAQRDDATLRSIEARRDALPAVP